MEHEEKIQLIEVNKLGKCTDDKQDGVCKPLKDVTRAFTKEMGLNRTHQADITHLKKFEKKNEELEEVIRARDERVEELRAQRDGAQVQLDIIEVELKKLKEEAIKLAEPKE